ncbi:MAG TPA: glycosyltransferase [Afifellaceae bacterium]|nr:glycosyltransferase [Afifellaceae bacterium]
MTRITILVTHLLGTGHLARALTLGAACKSGGFKPQVISGRAPPAHLDRSGVDLVQLPPVRSDGANFTRLLDDAGNPVTASLMAERSRAIFNAFESSPPDVLVTELFPFGRRILQGEFEAALSVAKKTPRPPLVLSSIRDILAPPLKPGKAEQTHARLARFYDGVLVHSDPEIIPLEASWPVTPDLAAMLHYTGFIAPPQTPVDNGSRDGAGEILVTAGGGPVGRKLFETAIAAAAISGQRRWRLLVGGGDAAGVCARLNDAAEDVPVTVEPARRDYRTMLGRCAAAVGQCGYNTALDWLQTGVPGVFVPFAEAGETEQTLRAQSLHKRFGYGLIAEADLTPQKLADAAEVATRRGRIAAGNLKLDGAATSVRIIGSLMEARR